MKIILFGSIAAGKSTIAKIIAEKFDIFKIIAIDDFRRQYGDNSMEQEKTAQQNFIEAIKKDENQIIEASGLGKLGTDIYEKICEFEEDILLIILSIPVEEIQLRIKDRTWDIPFPGGLENLDSIILSINFGIQFGQIPLCWSSLPKTTIFQTENIDKKTLNYIIQLIINYINLKTNDTI